MVAMTLYMPRRTMNAVGTYLRGLREAAGLTQAEAGAKINVDSKTVERWEGGKNEPPASRLAAYVAALGGSMARIVELLSGKPLTDEDEAWFRALSPEQKQKVRALLAAAEGKK